MYVHLRLKEIFSSVKNEPFVAVTFITVGDSFQHAPVGGKPVDAPYKNNRQNFDSNWRHFKVFELTEVMKQREDSRLIEILNNVQIADIKSTYIKLLESGLI